MKKSGKTTREIPGKKNSSRTPRNSSGNGISKQYLKSKPVCKVTFRLTKEAARNARRVSIVGDFNNWNLSEAPMKKLRNGDFKITLDLPCDREYNFRYLIDDTHWENDWCADRYVKNPYGSDDSVVVVQKNPLL